MVRDRTKEFIHAIHLVQGAYITSKSSVANGNTLSDSRRNQIVQKHANFMTSANKIAQNLVNAYSKLEKFTQLSKQKSLFGDKYTELQELSTLIKSDIKLLNEEIVKLQNVSKNQAIFRENNLKSHSSNIILTLQSRLAHISNNFTEILQFRTESLKQEKSRRNQFSNDFAIARSSQLRNRFVVKEDTNSIAIEMDEMARRSNSDGNMLISNELLGEQSQQINKINDVSNEYVLSRADAMQNIESTIIELGGIFNQLSHMIKEQEEMVERIDTNTEMTDINIEAAHSQILKYFQSVSSNRWLMFKIFGVLIFFFILFVLFLA